MSNARILTPKECGLRPAEAESLCEWVEEMRASGRPWEFIEEKLAGRLSNEVIAQIPSWHVLWQREQAREAKRAGHCEFEEEDRAQQEQRPAGESVDWQGAEKTAAELVNYLAEELLKGELKDGRLAWSSIGNRVLRKGQSAEFIKGPGQAGGKRWLYGAVVFSTGSRVDHVEVETRIGRRIRPGVHGYTSHAVRLERLALVGERLNVDAISSKIAALLHTFLGRASGIKSGAHLGRLTDRTRAAVSARRLGFVEKYLKAGGRGGFETVSKAAVRRRKMANSEQEGATDRRETGEHSDSMNEPKGTES